MKRQPSKETKNAKVFCELTVTLYASLAARQLRTTYLRNVRTSMFEVDARAPAPLRKKTTQMGIAKQAATDANRTHH